MIKLIAILPLTVLLLPGQDPRPRRIMRTDGGISTVQPGNTQLFPATPAAPEYTGPKGSLSGTVLDSATGAPIKKAQVRINYAGSQSVAVTDAAGSFTFQQLPPGTYFVSANHPEYPTDPTLRQPPEPVTVSPGEQKSGVIAKLTPGISVTGKITDDDGDPLANCSVNLFSRTVGQNLQTTHAANTNAAGDYTIPNLPAGKYYLQARCNAPYLQPRAFAPPTAIPAGPQLGYAARFYPGTTSFTGAQKVKLTAGQPARGLDFRMSLQTVTTVSVRVTGLDEERRNRLFASLVPNDNAGWTNFNSMAGMVEPRTGVAQIHHVPPGMYTLLLTSSGPERMVVGRETVQVAEEPREVTLQIMPALPLSGVIHKEIPPSTLKPGADPIKPAGNGGMISLSQVDEQGMLVSAPVAEDGSFTLKVISPGRYRVSAMGGFIQSISIGGETTDGPEFVLKQGAAGPLTVNVGFTTGILSGEVQLGESHPPQVLLFAVAGQGSHTSVIAAGTSGQPLKYSFPLPPGSYHVYALEVTDMKIADQLMTSEALAGRDEIVEVRPAAETTRNLKLVTAAEFEKADQ